MIYCTKNICFIEIKLHKKYIFRFKFNTALISVAFCGHYYNRDGTPNDPYHHLHLPHYPPLYPTYHAMPYTGFSCTGLQDQLWVDLATQCQVP